MNHLGRTPKVSWDVTAQCSHRQASGGDGDDDVGVVAGRLRQLFALIIQHHPTNFSSPLLSPDSSLRWTRSTSSSYSLKTPTFSIGFLFEFPAWSAERPNLLQHFLLSDLKFDQRSRRREEAGQRGETNLRMKERRVEGGARSFT